MLLVSTRLGAVKEILSEGFMSNDPPEGLPCLEIPYLIHRNVVPKGSQEVLPSSLKSAGTFLIQFL